MNKRKILYGTGAAILAVAAFLAVKANSKFNTTITNLYYTTGGVSHTCVLIASSVFQTVGSVGAGISFITATGGTANVFTTRSAGNCSNQITNKIRLLD